MNIILTEENIYNIMNRIKDSWVYLLSAYDAIRITAGECQTEIEKRNYECLEPIETVTLPLFFHETGFGSVQFDYAKKETFDYKVFTANIPTAIQERRNLSYGSLVPDGLVYIDQNSDGLWMNSIVQEMLDRFEMDLKGLLSAVFKKEENSLCSPEGTERQFICVTETIMGRFDLMGIQIPVVRENVICGVFYILSDSTFIHQKDKELILKAAFVKEIHHRVKNNLQTIASLLSLQMRRINSGKIEKAFLESINRISSIAIIHDELSKEGPERVNLKIAVNNIFNIILTNMVSKSKDIKGEIICEDIYVNANVASTLSLCVTELIQNAVEHAFVFRNKGSIIITIEEEGDMLSITVQDDGIGFNPHKAKPSLGLEIISMITEDTLKGNFYIEAHTYGTKSRIVFPKESIK